MHDWLQIVRERLEQAGFEGPAEREIAEELAYHLERRHAELIGAGCSEGEARSAVIGEIEGREWIEIMRRTRRTRPPALILGEPQRRGGFMTGLMHDTKIALRSMRTKPGFSLMVIGMLALGVAGNAAIFSVFNGLFLKPFPFDHPERLLDVDETAPRWNLKFVGVSNYDQDLWRRSNQTFENIAFFTGSGGNLSGEGAVQRIRGAQVTWNLLDVLHLKPALGRNFTAEDDKPGGPASVVLISHSLWRQSFRGDPSILGRVLKISERPYTVIGVLPPEAVIPDQVDVWLPLKADPASGSGWYLSGIGRLKPGVTIQQARADLLRVHRGVIKERSVNEITSPVMIPLRERYLGTVRDIGNVLLIAVGAVLLIACVNVAALMMVRGAARAREIAIRTAIGASRGRIVAQLLTESLLMAACAGIAGIAIGAGLLKAMIPLMPAALPKWVGFEFDARFALFCIAITGAAAMIFAILPAIQTSGVPARAALQENGARSTLSRGRTITLRGLVVAEVALALALLVSAGLVLQGFRRVSQVDPGFRTAGVMTFGIGLPSAKYKPEQTLAFYDRLLGELRAIPGVTSAAITSAPPLGGHTGNFFAAEGARPLGPNEKNPVVLTVWATPGYLDTAGISFLGGRDITQADGGPPEKSVAIVNQSFLKQYWPDLKSPADAVGKRIRYSGDKTLWMPVVGVVRDEKHYGLDEDMKPAVYLPFRNQPRNSFSTIIRAGVDPRSLAGAARDAVRKLDPDLPVYDVRILADRVRESLWLRRGSTWLFGAFAAVALILAAAGIYSVVSYAVSQRTHEIGIRMALGARPERVLGEVLRGGMTMVVIGIAAGIATAIATAGLLGTLLFGVNAKEPLVYAAVAGGVLLIGLLANIIPARRAASVDPMSALRSE